MKVLSENQQKRFKELKEYLEEQNRAKGPFKHSRQLMLLTIRALILQMERDL
jgi:hypothetical protein